jgi:hypothetical protein
MRPAHLRIAAVLFATVLPISAGSAQAPAAPAANSGDGLTALTGFVTRFENNILSLAEAMPADKYDFAPTKDIFKPGSPAEFATVHTFAQQVSHICGLPYRAYAPFGVKPDTDVDPKALDALKSKDELIKALKASFDYQNKVIATLTPDNVMAPVGPRNGTRIAALVLVLGDYGDHYGQMVEYGRMNGIIPPATANQMQRPPAPPQK